MNTFKQWFTLVELVVVVTIVAILWVLSFQSFSRYMGESRNSVRLDAVGKLSSKIDTYRAMDGSLLNLSMTGAELTGVSIAGTWASMSVYKSGIPNYTALSVQQENFLDPKTQDDYLLGVTTKVWWKYNIAFVLESSEWAIAKLIGTWNPRSAQQIAGVGRVGAKSFTVTDVSRIHFFHIGDRVTGTGVVLDTYIENISPEWDIILVSQPFTGSVSSLQLGQDEVGSLIKSIDGDTVPVLDNSIHYPYVVSY